MIKNNVKPFNTKKFLTYALARLDEDTVFHLVRQGMEQGVDSFTLIKDATAGMARVGELYQAGQYFLTDLIVAAEIFNDMLDLVFEEKPVVPLSNFPPVVFGTVEEDIHDIGKNIMIGILKANNIEVVDLGVDVPALEFARIVNDTGSRLVCLSGLITAAYDSMKKTVKVLEKEGMRPEVSVLIGGLVNEAVQEYTGADYFVTDCAVGSELCGRLLLGSQKKALGCACGRK